MTVIGLSYTAKALSETRTNPPGTSSDSSAPRVISSSTLGAQKSTRLNIALI